MKVEAIATSTGRAGHRRLRKQRPARKPKANLHRISLQPASAIRTMAYTAGNKNGKATVSLSARRSSRRCIKNRATRDALARAMEISATVIGFLGTPMEGVATKISSTGKMERLAKTIQYFLRLAWA